LLSLVNFALFAANRFSEDVNCKNAQSVCHELWIKPGWSAKTVRLFALVPNAMHHFHVKLIDSISQQSL